MPAGLSRVSLMGNNYLSRTGTSCYVMMVLRQQKLLVCSLMIAAIFSLVFIPVCAEAAAATPARMRPRW